MCNTSSALTLGMEALADSSPVHHRVDIRPGTIMVQWKMRCLQDNPFLSKLWSFSLELSLIDRKGKTSPANLLHCRWCFKWKKNIPIGVWILATWAKFQFLFQTSKLKFGFSGPICCDIPRIRCAPRNVHCKAPSSGWTEDRKLHSTLFAWRFDKPTDGVLKGLMLHKGTGSVRKGLIMFSLQKYPKIIIAVRISLGAWKGTVNNKVLLWVGGSKLPETLRPFQYSAPPSAAAPQDAQTLSSTRMMAVTAAIIQYLAGFVGGRNTDWLLGRSGICSVRRWKFENGKNLKSLGFIKRMKLSIWSLPIYLGMMYNTASWVESEDHFFI